MSDYLYDATVVRVIDGDTIDVHIDLGFSLIKKERVRLARINAPEKTGHEKPEGLITKAFVEDEFPVGTEITLETFKAKGKFSPLTVETEALKRFLQGLKDNG